MRIQKRGFGNNKNRRRKNEWINELDGEVYFASCNENRVGETLGCIERCFIGTMPATMAGAIAVLLNAFMRDFPNTYLGEGNAITTFFTPVIGVNGLIWNGTLAIMAVVFVLSLGANLRKPMRSILSQEVLFLWLLLLSAYPMQQQRC